MEKCSKTLERWCMNDNVEIEPFAHANDMHGSHNDLAPFHIFFFILENHNSIRSWFRTIQLMMLMMMMMFILELFFYSCWLYLYILTFDSRFASLSHIFDSCRSQIMMYSSGRWMLIGQCVWQCDWIGSQFVCASCQLRSTRNPSAGSLDHRKRWWPIVCIES